jgi:hypothetical protein
MRRHSYKGPNSRAWILDDGQVYDLRTVYFHESLLCMMDRVYHSWAVSVRVAIESLTVLDVCWASLPAIPYGGSLLAHEKRKHIG